MARLTPKDRGEQIALFRAEVIGGLARREMSRGELAAALREIAAQRFRPPGAAATRTYAVPTLQRWYYALRRGGLDALAPRARTDRGRGRVLTPAQRDLLLEIRREYPRASVPVILRTLVADGRLEPRSVSAPTVRRLYREHGLDRRSRRDAPAARTRLRWQAERPGALWHGDVCHAGVIMIDGKPHPVRIHALLDDASRYVVALEAHHTEREIDMLGLLVRALRRHGPPDAIYLDNGSTYRGDILRTACARLGISLLHARPYDAPARGKMERFWRTLREGCLDFAGNLASLHDVGVRLWAFLDQHYHRAPHASLLGRSPGAVFAAGGARLDDLDEEKLRAALTVRVRRRVRRDSTVPVDGCDWELDQGFLAGRLVRVARCMVDLGDAPWIEHEGKRLVLRPVDPVRNSRRRRVALEPAATATAATTGKPVTFDPAGALLDRAAGRRRKQEDPA
jgi:transposase InsO family protein